MEVWGTPIKFKFYRSLVLESSEEQTHLLFVGGTCATRTCRFDWNYFSLCRVHPYEMKEPRLLRLYRSLKICGVTFSFRGALAAADGWAARVVPFEDDLWLRPASRLSA